MVGQVRDHMRQVLEAWLAACFSQDLIHGNLRMCMASASAWERWPVWPVRTIIDGS